MPKPANDVERAFDAFMSLSTAEQAEFRTLLRGREWAAPPAQQTIPIAAAKARSHKKQKPAPGAPQTVGDAIELDKQAAEAKTA
jgi:hypothetical protein